MQGNIENAKDARESIHTFYTAQTLISPGISLFPLLTMVSVKVNKEGWAFLTLVASGTALCSAEYYLYYKGLAGYTRAKFLSSNLPDLPEYQKEAVIDTGANKVAFPHKGGPKAVENVLSDTFEESRFRRCLGLQFGSTYSFALGRLKKKRFTPFVALGLLAGNCLFLYPTLISYLGLYHLAHLVSQSDLHVWGNLTEMRFVQRVREAMSVELRRSEQGGLVLVTVCSVYCAPFLASFVSGVVWLYLTRTK